MKKLWEKIKMWLLVKWEVLKEWLKKHWMVIVNYLVIFIAYSLIFEKGVSGAEAILGLWLFASGAYGLYKLFEWLNNR